MTALEIIDLLGGVQPVSTHTGWPYTTIKAWITYNQIPEWRQHKLLDLAARLNVSLGTTDFPSSDERIAKSEAA